MYKSGDTMIEVRELLIKAFASAWREEGPGLTDGEELDHLSDLVRADGLWVYYGVPDENYFLVTWMSDEAAARQKVADLTAQGGCVACVVDLSEEWRFD